MKLKVFSTVLFVLFQLSLYSNTIVLNDSILPDDIVEDYDLESMLDSIAENPVNHVKVVGDTVKIKYKFTEPELAPVEKADTSLHFYDIYSLISDNDFKIDTLILQNNPLFIDLVYKESHVDLNLKDHLFPYTYFFGVKPQTLIQRIYKPIEVPAVGKIINDLRSATIKQLSIHEPKLFAFKYEKLPGTDGVKSQMLAGQNFQRMQLVDNSKYMNSKDRKLVVKKIEASPWKTKANSLIQFSQNYVSNNWYQGGSQNIAVLGMLTGQLNYDDKKNIQWDNNAEWRVGFNSVDGDTLRILNTNDDVFKINSKLGIKAGGNWFYSGSVDFSTQLFHNYKAINSTVMKASFLTPVRLNIGVGLDYKYKKLFSLMVSPVSYKYIYVNDNVNVNPNLFGIAKDENVLSEIGSSFKAQFSYAPVREIQIDSKLSFYTNYEKVEVDWEIVSNFTINRYLSTRLSLNPRYDNTLILAAGEKTKLQFKELLSFGFSYKLLN